jgi:hypothetical protein
VIGHGMPFSTKAEPMFVTVVSYHPNGYSPALRVFKGDYQVICLIIWSVGINYNNCDLKIITTHDLSIATERISVDIT